MSEWEQVLHRNIDLILDMLDQERPPHERAELLRELAELERLIPDQESEIAA